MTKPRVRYALHRWHVRLCLFRRLCDRTPYVRP
jgi:hypothetical protein